ncbi:MAG: M50 family metallopeptidase [Nitrososphaeraceae archaeon]
MGNQAQSNKVRAEIKFPLILIHTPYGLSFFDKVAGSKIAKIYARFNTYLMPLITALAVFLIVGSLMVLFSNGAAREGVRDIGPQSNLLIPGLNPYLPWTYGWIALVLTIIIHEAGHGIVARVYGVKVESTGLVLILGIPIGAFVNIEREELTRTKLREKSAILTAGPMNNMIVAGLSLGLLYLVISSLVPLPQLEDVQYGVEIMTVGDGSLASSIGMKKGDVIVDIEGDRVKHIEDLSRLLQANLGNRVAITWKDSGGQEITKIAPIPESVQPNTGILGVTITNISPDPEFVLSRYKSAFSSNPIAILLPPTMAEGSVPYSDLMASKYTSTLGPAFPIIANFLFWLWFINFNVGIFNALPIGPLDGGQLYNSLIERKVSAGSTRFRNASLILTLVMVLIVAATFVLPWILG